MSIIVQKFGGSSLANLAKRECAIERILQRYNEGYSVVIVVSAMGRKKDKYSTDALLGLIGDNKDSLRSADLIMSCGEIISAVVLADMLRKRGIKACAYSGGQAGIITNDNYGQADVLYVNTDRIMKCVDKGEVAVVAGFQGITENGEVTTLGRGGSDTSAVLLGNALNCDFVEIYTDVDGVLTADPKIVSDARIIKEICYNELYQLAEDGAKVIHPKAVEIAQNKNMKVFIRNTEKCDYGTLVSNITTTEYYANSDKVISAITHRSNKIQVTIETINNNKLINELMKKIAQKNISIDLINLFVGKVMFTINNDELKMLEEIVEGENCTCKTQKGLSKLSIIGHRMCGKPGVMQRIVNALYSEDIEILQTSDSHTTIWCLIETKNINKAINSLHKEFELNR